MVYTATAPALSSRETSVLQWADKGGRARVTTRDIQSLFGERAGIRIVASLARKGVLDRVGRGVYSVRPLGAMASPPVLSVLARVAHLLSDEPYYVGGPTALTLHRGGVGPEGLPACVDVYSMRHRRARDLSGVRVVFRRSAIAGFNFGVMEVEVDGVMLVVSDAERTVLDLLEWPERPLGMSLAVKALHDALPRLRTRRLIQYALRWPTVSTLQRLGLLLERAGADAQALAPLAARVAESSGVPSLLPGARRIGGVHPVWRLVVNDRNLRLPLVPEMAHA